MIIKELLQTQIIAFKSTKELSQKNIIGDKLFTIRSSLWIFGWKLYKGLANRDSHPDQERDPRLHNLVMIVTQLKIYLIIIKITLADHTTLHVFKDLKL